jgi:hypothetical protein
MGVLPDSHFGMRNIEKVILAPYKEMVVLGQIGVEKDLQTIHRHRPQQPGELRLLHSGAMSFVHHSKFGSQCLRWVKSCGSGLPGTRAS